MTAEELREHLKHIGQAIIDDSEGIDFDTETLRGVEITIRIFPCEITEINYQFHRTSDTRITKVPR